MGPPKIAHDGRRVARLDLTAPDGSVQRGRAILDPVAESWHPYYYRIVALGFDDPAHGEFRGESIASVVQRAFLTTRPLHRSSPILLPTQTRRIAGSAFAQTCL
jgi:hypothetical protein